MIDCPNCGAFNRNGSKYCSSCGKRLAADSDGTCPACGHLGTSNVGPCPSCGHPLAQPPFPHEPGGAAPRLASRSDSYGADAPNPRPPAVKPHPHLPPWLYPTADQDRELRSSPVQRGGDSSPRAPLRKDASRYLRGIRGVLPDVDGWLDSALSDYLADEAKDQGIGALRNDRSDG